MRKDLSPTQRFVYAQMDRWKAEGLSRWPTFTGDDEVIRELHFELTYRCNLKCVMCDLWEQEIKDTTKIPLELTVPEIRRFVGASRKLDKLQVVVLSGGEAMLKNEVVDLVEYFTAQSPQASVGILSNLLNEDLVRRRLEEIHRRCAPRLWIGTSMDGVGPTHDRVRGETGAWDRMIKTIESVRRDFPKVDVSITYTMTPLNYRELLAVHDHAEKLGCGFGAQFVVQKEGTDVFRWKPEQLDEVARQVDVIVERLCRGADAMGRLFRGEAHDAKWLWARLYYWRTLVDYGYKPARYFEPCLAGRRYAMLDPWGNISFCSPHKKKPIGNVRERAFDEIWEGEKSRRLRQHIDAQKCDCWLMCTANPVIDRVLDLALPSPVAASLAPAAGG
jgi:radical SAM protein with 4Fe4S-binding SPASM domain